MSPHFTDEEIDGICDGLTQNAARVRYLRKLGLHVETKPNGRPLVARSNWETVMGRAPAVVVSGETPPGVPDEKALLDFMAERKRRRSTAAV